MTKPIHQDTLLDQLRGLGLFVTHLPKGEQPALMIEYRTALISYVVKCTEFSPN